MIIDTSAHILPGFEPGPEDLAEAVRLCRAAEEDGVTDIVASPHMPCQGDGPTPEEVLRAVEALSRALDAEGVEVCLHAGAQVELDVGLMERLLEGRLLTVARGGRFLALRLPEQVRPFEIADILRALQLQGIEPILLRVEANRVLQRFPDFAAELAEAGALVAVSAGSLVGDPRRPEVACALTLLRRRLIHLVPSDADGSEERAVRWPEVRAAIADRACHEEGLKLLRRRPVRILRGEWIHPRMPRNGNGRRRRPWEVLRSLLPPAARRV